MGAAAMHWRRRIRREVVWLLAVKFVALLVLWYLFFGPAHRHAVDGEDTSRHLGMATRAAERK
jgi:type VI protein secretion system component VasF